MSLWQIARSTFRHHLFVFFRLPRVTVHHEYIGSRSYQVSPLTSVHRVKQLLYEETDLPVREQRLSHNGRQVGYSHGSAGSAAVDLDQLSFGGHHRASGFFERFLFFNTNPSAQLSRGVEHATSRCSGAAVFGRLCQRVSKHDWNWSPQLGVSWWKAPAGGRRSAAPPHLTRRNKLLPRPQTCTLGQLLQVAFR